MPFWKKKSPESPNKTGLYVAVLFAAVLVPLTVLGWLSSSRWPQTEAYVYEWQQRSGGLAPPSHDAFYRWKAYLLTRTAPEVETAVLGSSSALQIGGEPGLFNYAHELATYDCSFIYYNYLLEHAPHLKRIIFSMDLYPYYFYPRDYCADREAIQKILETGQTEDRGPRMLAFDVKKGFFQNLKDDIAVSARRFERRWRRLSAEHDFRNWWRPFEITCGATGTPSLDTENAPSCSGYRSDGSRVYAMPVFPPGQEALFGWVPESGRLVFENSRQDIFDKNLSADMPEQLKELALLARRAREKNIQTFILLPPLKPGVETATRAFVVNAQGHAAYKKMLEDFAAGEKAGFLDASASENFGCRPDQFYNENHAKPECYREVLKALEKTR